MEDNGSMDCLGVITEIKNDIDYTGHSKQVSIKVEGEEEDRIYFFKPKQEWMLESLSKGDTAKVWYELGYGFMIYKPKL